MWQNNHLVSALLPYKLILFAIVAIATVASADSPSFYIGGADFQNLSLAQVIQLNGFKAKTYKVTTADGYIVTVTNVINPKDQNHTTKNSSRRTVAIHHGISESILSPQLANCGHTRPKAPPTRSSSGATSGATSGRQQQHDEADIERAGSGESANSSTYCLIYYLSNNGYDVWLFEARGSTPEASGHVNGSIVSEDYWNFDVGVQARHDVPAQIDKVLELTGQDKLAYIGYSISTAYMFILLSERPEFGQEKLLAVVQVAPIAYLNHVKGETKLAASVINLLPSSWKNKQNKAYPNTWDKVQAGNRRLVAFCKARILATTICRAMINSIDGPDDFGNNLTVSLFSRRSGTTSFKTFFQAAQWTKHLTFNNYDYGDEKLNMQHYNQSTAPEYNITNIRHPHLIFVRSEKNDDLSTAGDQKELISRLPQKLYKDIVVDSSYDHLSYWIYSNAFDQVTVPVEKVLNEIFEKNGG